MGGRELKVAIVCMHREYVNHKLCAVSISNLIHIKPPIYTNDGILSTDKYLKLTQLYMHIISIMAKHKQYSWLSQVLF